MTFDEKLVELQQTCEYSEDEDSSVDSLIGYKNALEEGWSVDATALDALTLILREDPWPSGADFLDWCNEIVSATGRDTSEPLPEEEEVA